MVSERVSAAEVYDLINYLDEFYLRHRRHLPDHLALKVTEAQVELTKFELQLTIEELGGSFATVDELTLQEA